jgi:putative ABC transport system permease protein
MDFAEAFFVAIDAMRANKLRAGLTMLGVIIGVAAVITLVSIGQSARNQVVAEFGSLGPDLLWVLPGKAKDERHGGVAAEEGRLTLTYEDALAVERNASFVRAVSPILQTSLPVYAGKESTTTVVVGTTPSLQPVRGMSLSSGRFLTEADLTRRERVVVLGSRVKEDLFGFGRNPLGEKVTINGRSFTVVGVLEPKGQLLGIDLDDRIYIPLTTAQQLFDIQYISFMFVQADSVDAAGRAASEVRRVLQRLHQAEDFTVLTQSQLLSSLDAILRILTIALTSIAAISLVVGGIGIMNIMLVSVTERTREIGIRKAVGARRSDILVQFLIEAVVLSLVGGIVGMVVGIGGSAAIVIRLLRATPTAAQVLPIVVLAFSFSVLVGMIFGVYPAWRASQLHPIEALRYE